MPQVDNIFKALSDPTRRDILQRLSQSQLTILEIAAAYDMSLPAISKHVTVLKKAKLVKKTKSGREHTIYIQPQTLKTVADYVAFYKKFWTSKLDQLEIYLAQEENQ